MWDQYVDRETDPSAWWWHRSGWIHYSALRLTSCRNLSFGVIDKDRRLRGICPLIQEGDTFAFGDSPCPAPLWQTVDAGQAITEHLGYLLKSVKSAIFNSDTVFLPGANHERISWKMRTLTLKRDIHTLWKEVRKSYRQVIDKSNDLDIIVAQDDVSLRMLQHLHYVSAGKSTRSLKTWDLMVDWLRNDAAFLVLAKRKGIPVGAVYIYQYKQRAYYGHAAVERNIAHPLIWKAIQESQQRNLEYFDLGWQAHAQDEKGQNIEFFRRGFGGSNRVYPVTRVSYV
jgi:hypothetical protein